MQRNGCDPALLTRDCIGYENGVLGGVVSALTSFANPGDPILVHSPTYIGFTKSLKNNGFEIVHSPLVRDEAGVWRMDYADMDRKLKEHHIHAAILCSPHNPCGRVWTPEELARAMEVYRANDCVVISDEIWSDILLNGHKHTPTQSVSEDARRRTIALYAPSKTFNLAGLVGSYHIIYDEYLRDRVRAKASKSHYNSMNVLSMHALSARTSTASKRPSPRAPICSLPTAPSGAQPTARPSRRSKRPPGRWASPCRTAGCSTAPAPCGSTWPCPSPGCRRPSAGWTGMCSMPEKSVFSPSQPTVASLRSLIGRQSDCNLVSFFQMQQDGGCL